MYQTPIIKVACPIPVTLFQQLPPKIRHGKRKMEYEGRKHWKKAELFLTLL
jgi:hypothetical protein